MLTEPPIKRLATANPCLYVTLYCCECQQKNGKKIKMIEVEANSLSVDTPKDLDKVIDIIKGKKYE